MAKLKDVTNFYERYIKVNNPKGFFKWVDGVLNEAMNRIENEK